MSPNPWWWISVEQVAYSIGHDAWTEQAQKRTTACDFAPTCQECSCGKQIRRGNILDQWEDSSSDRTHLPRCPIIVCRPLQNPRRWDDLKLYLYLYILLSPFFFSFSITLSNPSALEFCSLRFPSSPQLYFIIQTTTTPHPTGLFICLRKATISVNY